MSHFGDERCSSCGTLLELENVKGNQIFKVDDNPGFHYLCQECHELKQDKKRVNDIIKNRSMMLETVDCMKRHGGQFVACLAECMLWADDDNLEAIASTWPDIMEQYRPENWRTS